MKSILAVLAVLAAATVPAARGQVRGCADLDRLNRRLAGQVVDYTHNHGADRRLYSPILGRPRDLYVYLPPGYDPLVAYPLILFLHGADVDEHDFLDPGDLKALDRMMSAGRDPAGRHRGRPTGRTRGENRLPRTHSLWVNGWAAGSRTTSWPRSCRS